MLLGDLTLTENVFFLGHDLFTGKLRIRQDMLDIGLAGAVLADLVFDGRVDLDGGILRVTSRQATGDAAIDRVLAMVVREPGRFGVRDWVERLRTGIFRSVAEKLTAERMVTAKDVRGLFRKSTLYLATDLRTASTPRSRVRAAMMGHAQTGLPTAMVCLLAWSIGLDDICEPDLNRRQAAEWIHETTAGLVDPLVTLLAGVDAAVAAVAYGKP